jgi:hypothetical protein
MVCMDWFCNYCIICTNLSLEPQYVILLALAVILLFILNQD